MFVKFEFNHSKTEEIKLFKFQNLEVNKDVRSRERICLFLRSLNQIGISIKKATENPKGFQLCEQHSRKLLV